jgi:hypothetical protein
MAFIIDQYPVLFILILSIVFLTLTFSLLRNVVLWYFRIPERIELMREQNRLLSKIAGETE